MIAAKLMSILANNNSLQGNTNNNNTSAKFALSKKEYLEKKFTLSRNTEEYIYKCLNKDILDFQDYTKEQIKMIKPSQEKLINLLQECVNQTIPDYEIKLFGSHATNLCLNWSDLDVVLVNKKNNQMKSNLTILNQLYLKLLVSK